MRVQARRELGLPVGHRVRAARQLTGCLATDRERGSACGLHAHCGCLVLAACMVAHAAVEVDSTILGPRLAVVWPQLLNLRMRETKQMLRTPANSISLQRFLQASTRAEVTEISGEVPAGESRALK